MQAASAILLIDRVSPVFSLSNKHKLPAFYSTWPETLSAAYLAVPHNRPPESQRACGRPKVMKMPSVQQPPFMEPSLLPLSSRAQPRDLQFRGPFLEMFFDRAQRGRRESDGCPTFAKAYVGRKRWGAAQRSLLLNRLVNPCRIGQAFERIVSLQSAAAMTIQNALPGRSANSSFPSRPLASPGLPGSNARIRFPIAHAWPPSQRTATVNKAWR
jgi:hypothetical protein